MSADDMANSNERLSTATDFEPQLSRMMGLYVVGRLAARHGTRVQLRPAPSGGLTALIHLPPEVVVDPMTQAGAELPPMSSPISSAALLGPDDDLAHPGTQLPGPLVRPDVPVVPPAPVPAYGLAGLPAGAPAMPRPAFAGPLAPIAPAGPPSGRLGPGDSGRPLGGPPGLPVGPLPGAASSGPGDGGRPLGGPPGVPVGPLPGAVPSGLPPLPRREPYTAWPPPSSPPPSSTTGPDIGLVGDEPQLPEPDGP